MHPPFGFALFYLRGAADSIFKAGSLPKKVLSKDIYLGSIPFVLLQLILVVIVIFFPQTVTIFVDKQQVIDINSVKIEVPEQTNQESDEQTANEQLMKSFK
jgi:hypothetical protein